MLQRKDHRLIAYALRDGFESALEDLARTLQWLSTDHIRLCLLDGVMPQFEMKLHEDNHEFDCYEFADIVLNRLR